MKIRKKVNPLAIKALFKAIFPDDEWDLPSKAESWIVTDDDSMPVGFCCAYRLAHENGCFMALAGLLPCARGKGLHKRMIQTRIKWAKAHGLEYALTYTVTDNQSSYDNLQDMGFRLYEPDYQYAGKKMYYWIKRF